MLPAEVLLVVQPAGVALGVPLALLACLLPRLPGAATLVLLLLLAPLLLVALALLLLAGLVLRVLRIVSHDGYSGF